MPGFAKGFSRWDLFPGLCVNLLFLRSSQKIIQRDFKDIRNFQQDFHFGFPRHQLIILICLFGDIAIDCNLPLGEPFLFLCIVLTVLPIFLSYSITYNCS